MGSLGQAGTRRLLCVLAVSALAVGAIATWALAAGSGGWERLGVGPGGIRSLDLVASALAVAPGGVYVGGEFTGAGGVPNTNRIAKWNGSSWSAISTPTSQISNGRVSAIAVSGNRVFAGGTFTGAGVTGTPTSSRCGRARAGPRSATRPARRRRSAAM